MVQILILVCIVFCIRMFVKAGTWDKLLSSSAFSPYAPAVRGVLAWSVVALIGWGVWQVVVTVNRIIEYPLSFSSALEFGKLASILLGVGFVYQAIVMISETGDTSKLRASFVNMLFFQRIHKLREDIFEKLHQAKLEEQLEHERNNNRQEPEDKSQDENFEKHFGI